MTVLAFTIPGEPQAWQRAGVRTVAGYAQHYTKAPTRSYESLVKMAAAEAMGERLPLDEPVICTITIRKTPPKSTSKVKRAAMLAGTIRPSTKPDCSNIAKGIEDALNGIAYRDDALICALHVIKVFAEIAGVDVKVQPLAPQAVA